MPETTSPDAALQGIAKDRLCLLLAVQASIYILWSTLFAYSKRWFRCYEPTSATFGPASKISSSYICPKWNFLTDAIYYTASFVQYCREWSFPPSFLLCACMSKIWSHSSSVYHAAHLQSLWSFWIQPRFFLIISCKPPVITFSKPVPLHSRFLPPQAFGFKFLLLSMMQPIACVCEWEVNTLLSLAYISDCTRVCYNTEQYDCSHSFGVLFCKAHHISQEIKLLIPLYNNFNNSRYGDSSPPFNLDSSKCGIGSFTLNCSQCLIYIRLMPFLSLNVETVKRMKIILPIFLVLCPFKRPIWQPYYASMNLHPTHMLALLRTLKASRLVHPSQVHTIPTIVWTTLWLLWASHW